MKVHLFIVDPQNDFCVPDDGRGNRGSLVVPGALDDMRRLAGLVRRVGSRLDDITVTLDSHQGLGIERPRWWKRVGDGAEPAPFTVLGIHPDGRRIVKYVPGKAGLEPTDEAYTTFLPAYLHQGGATGKGAFGYLEALARAGRYPHVIWPVHCRVGSWGFGVVPVLDEALYAWEIEQYARVNYVAKGNNPDTEHFSGVRAEVPDPRDPATQVNTRLIQALEEADVIALAGEALSHCVANTGRDIADCFADPRYVEKMVLLTDATSNVGGFEALGAGFQKELQARGMKTATCADFLA
ncbi:MAG: hypothetical protein R3F60_08495 [bacterium]